MLLHILCNLSAGTYETYCDGNVSYSAHTSICFYYRLYIMAMHLHLIRHMAI
jgi:hypothetical protein